jgi:hypothetical protein
MHAKGISAVAVVILLLFAPWRTAAGKKADPSADWKSVTELPSGTRLFVVLEDGRRVQGQLKSASDEGLILVGKNQVVEVERGEVREIRKPDKKAGTRGLAAGIGIGFISGVIAGFVASHTDESAEDKAGQLVLGTGAVGAAIGGGTGWLVNLGKKVTVYKAPVPERAKP